MFTLQRVSEIKTTILDVLLFWMETVERTVEGLHVRLRSKVRFRRVHFHCT